MFRHARLVNFALVFTVAVALAAAAAISTPAQSSSSSSQPLATAVIKLGEEVDLRSDAKILEDEALSGHVTLPSEEGAGSQTQLGDSKEPLFGPNIQVNDPALDNIQIFPGFRPFVHFTTSETTVAAKGRNIVVSYNNSAGLQVGPNPAGPGLVFTQILISGFSSSTDGGRTFTSGFVPAAPGVGPVTFGDGVVVVDRRGNFYYASLGSTADGHGSVTVNKSTDGGKTFGPGVIAGVDDGSDKNWIAVGPDPKNRGRDNVYVTWTSFTNTGSEVAFAVSTDGGQTFQQKILFAPGTDPDPTHPQNAVQFTNPVVDRSNGRLYIPFARFSNADTDFLTVLASDDAGQTFHFLKFNMPGTPDPTLLPLVQPGTFEDCGRPGGGLRLAIIQGSDIGGGRFGLPRFVHSSRLTIQPAFAASNGRLFLAYNSSDSPFFGDPSSGSNILLVTSKDGGNTWSGPRQVNPSVGGEPRHVYPAIAIGDGGESADVTFYTQHTDGSVDVDLVSVRQDDGKVELSYATRITDQSFDLVPSNIPIPTAALPFRTTNFDRNIVACYDLGEYIGLFNNDGKVYATWGDNRNLVTQPVNALDPISGQTHPHADTFFQSIRPED